MLQQIGATNSIGNTAYADASGTVGTSSTQALAAGKANYLIMLQNVSATNSLAYTVDGTAATINTPGSLMLLAGQGVILSNPPPSGIINVTGSGSGTVYTLKFA